MVYLLNAIGLRRRRRGSISGIATIIEEFGCLPIPSQDMTEIILNQPYATTLYCYKHMVIFMFKSYCSAQLNRVHSYQSYTWPYYMKSTTSIFLH